MSFKYRVDELPCKKWLDFENVQNLFLIAMKKKKQLYNYSNIPFLSFFFSFSAWCWSNVIFNAFTFKNPVEYVFTLTALCPHLRLYEYLKSARLLNCVAFPASRSVPWSVSIICNTQALLQLTIIICFILKLCVFFCSCRRQCGPLFSDSGKI